jgi:hypothetical protein
MINTYTAFVNRIKIIYFKDALFENPVLFTSKIIKEIKHGDNKRQHILLK